MPTVDVFNIKIKYINHAFRKYPNSIREHMAPSLCAINCHNLNGYKIKFYT